MVAGDAKIIQADHSPRKAVVCDGTDDYFSANAFGAARVVTGDTVGTFCGWVNVVANSASYAMISLGDWNVDEYLWFGIENAKLIGQLYDAAAMQWDINSTTATDIKDGWHHIAIVQNGTRPTFYLDGAAVAMTDTVSTDLTVWISALAGCDLTSVGILAKNATLTMDMDGAISDVKYYNLALSAKQINDEYNGNPVATTLVDATTGAATGLISWWRLNGDYLDMISGHNGTKVNNAYLDNNYSQLTQECNSAWVAAGDAWTITSAAGQLTVLHIEGV